LVCYNPTNQPTKIHRDPLDHTSVRPKESASEASPHSEEATELGTSSHGKSQDLGWKNLKKPWILVENQRILVEMIEIPTSSNHDWHQIQQTHERGVFEKIGIILLFVRKIMLMSHD